MLEKIYARTSSGATQEWLVVVTGDSYSTHEGLVGGKITTSKPTVCLPKNEGKKNETSGEEQALKEAQALWKKKIDSGYTPDITKIDEVGFFEPMLAHKYGDYDTVFPVGSNCKLDGIRCIINKNSMMSRTGKPILAAPHILKALQPVFDKCPDMVFDGELYCSKLKNDFNKIISLVKKVKPTAEELKESADTIQYWIYDLPNQDGYSARSAKLKKIIEELNNPCIVYVSNDVANNQVELDTLYGKYLDDGMEGQMIRILDSKYENKRSKNLLKRKEFIDTEYEIIGVEEGLGGRSGTVGYMTMKMEDGTIFKSNVKGTHVYLAELLKNKESLIGKKATVKYFCLTPAGIPRFPYVIAIRDYE